MPHVPRTGHSRSSHRHAVRTTHDYDAAFNGFSESVSASAEEVAVQDAADGIVSSWQIPAHIITAGKLAETLAPPEVVEVKPTLPDVNYPPGSLIVYLPDGKLWRNVADVWTVAVATSDLTGTIIGTQIEDGEITTEKIKVGAVTADQILAGSVTADKILAGSVTAAALAAEIVLTSQLKTAASGRRVELDTGGIRHYDAAEKLVVNIPTVGTDPVSVSGEIEASSLVSTLSAELRGANDLPGGSVTTLGVGVTTPSAAPVIVSTLPYTSLSAAPAYPGHGICFDPDGYTDGVTDTYWVGADPTVGNLLDMAYEYNTSGTLLRTIRKTGTTQTLTDTQGSTSHISDRANGYVGDTDSAFGINIAMPADRGTLTITKVSVYLAGREGTCSVRNELWNSSGTELGYSANYTAADKGATGVGDSLQYNKNLSTPVAVAAGATIRAGYARMNDTDGSQHDVDTGSYTTYIGDGNGGSMTGVRTVTTERPNIFVTYEYQADSSVEGTTGKIIGVARQGSYIWCLDANGWLFRYNQNTLAFVDKFDLSAKVTGTKANAGLFFDGTSLIIITTPSTSAGVQVKFVKVNTSGAWVSDHATTGLAVSGATDTLRGGWYESNGHYWISVSGTVRPYVTATYAYLANYEFGASSECGSGITWDGTYFHGWSSASNPSKNYRYTSWNWTTESSVFWLCYTWYDDDATGGTHETAVSPRASITLGRRRQLSVSNAALPGGTGTDKVTKVRIYMARGAGDPGGANYDLQVTDALTNRTFITYNSGGAANPTSNNFPGGNAAILKSMSGEWQLKGDGSFSCALPAWTAVTFTNSWTNYGAGFTEVAYYKDPFGVVHLRGLMKSGTLGSSAFNLPSGYRPAARLLFRGLSNASGTWSLSASGRVDITTDGNVTPHATECNNAFVTLDGIRFRTDA